MTQNAGRAGKNGFLTTEPVYSRDRDTASSSTRPVPPDDILFNRKGARIRLAEEDEYVGIDDLGPIPPNDLLETMHRYVSQLYDRPNFQRNHLHYRSMDGTALLALGVLLEEALEQSLGETGHLAFLTAVEEEESTAPELGWDGHTWVKRASRKLGSESQSFRSAHNDDTFSHDELDEDEASEVIETEEDNEAQDGWQSSSPYGEEKKTEPRTESPEYIHERPPTTSCTKPLRSPSSSNRGNIEISATEPRSARKIVARRSRRIHGDKGYKSTAMVQSSDEDESGAPFSEHDIEMADPEEPIVQRVSALPEPSTTSGSQSDSEGEESETSPRRAVVERGNEPSRSARRAYRDTSRSQVSKNSREMSRTKSEESTNDEEESSESEDEDTGAEATAPTHHDQPDRGPERNTTREKTSKASVNKPKDKMAKFKKSMDDLLDRLMSQ